MIKTLEERSMMMNKKFNYAGSIFLLIYLILAVSVMTNSKWVNTVDIKIIEMIQSSITENGASVISFLTDIGGVEEVIIFTVAVVIILFIMKMYVAGFWLGMTVLISPGILVSIMKLIVNRDRPQFMQLAVESSQSFPSGHSTASTVFYGLIGVSLILLVSTLWKRVIIGLIMFSIVFFVMSSRVYLGVHFPTDVLAGFAFGSASVFISLSLYQFIRPKLQQWLQNRNIHDKSPSLFK